MSAQDLAEHLVLGHDDVERVHRASEPIVSRAWNRPIPVRALPEEPVRPLLRRIHLEVGVPAGLLAGGAEESQQRARSLPARAAGLVGPHRELRRAEARAGAEVHRGAEGLLYYETRGSLGLGTCFRQSEGMPDRRQCGCRKRIA